jgi:N-acylneuraminate cytidylyltransferase
MITYSIIAAQNSNLFDKIYVSSEDSVVIEISRKYGAEIIKRPKKLSDDFTPTIPVIRHAIEWMTENDIYPDAVCCIYACSPLVLPDDIIAGYNTLIEDNWEFVISATDFAYPIQRAFKIKDNGSLAMLNPENYNKRTQDLEPVFHDADKFYWGRTKAWMENSLIFSEKSTAVRIPQFRVQVIDTEQDWIKAEIAYKTFMENKNNK